MPCPRTKAQLKNCFANLWARYVNFSVVPSTSLSALAQTTGDVERWYNIYYRRNRICIQKKLIVLLGICPFTTVSLVKDAVSVRAVCTITSYGINSTPGTDSRDGALVPFEWVWMFAMQYMIVPWRFPLSLPFRGVKKQYTSDNIFGLVGLQAV